MDFNLDQMMSELKRDEGVKNTPYKDTLGNYTIGVGHLITDVKNLPKFWDTAMINEVLIEDITEAYQRISGTIWYKRLDTDNRRRALVNMSFNLGNNLFKFHNFLKHLEQQQWSMAAMDLNLSLWHQEVGPRGGRIMGLIRNG